MGMGSIVSSSHFVIAEIVFLRWREGTGLWAGRTQRLQRVALKHSTVNSIWANQSSVPRIEQKRVRFCLWQRRPGVQSRPAPFWTMASLATPKRGL